MAQSEKKHRADDSVRVKERHSPPRQYHVVFHNDDKTTMEFVVEVLQSVFGKRPDEAAALMMKVHIEGKAVVATYSYDIALSKIHKATQMARREGFPLVITCEPAS